VPLYRKHVFAGQIKPTTRTRIDFGLALGDTKAKDDWLIPAASRKRIRITHRFEITTVKDINDEVKRWLKVAYERGA